jgi:hypothetical protein
MKATEQQKLAMKKWYEKTKEKRKEQMRKYWNTIKENRKPFRKKYYQQHKKYIKKKSKEYREKNKDKIKQQQKKSYEKNKEKYKKKFREYLKNVWYPKNKESYQKKKLAHENNRRKIDVNFRIKKLLRHRVWEAFKNYSMAGKIKTSDEYGIDYYITRSIQISAQG